MFGIHSPKVREKLLNVDSDLTLDKAIDIVRSLDMAQAQLKTIASGNSGLHEQTVHAVGRYYSKKTWKTRQDKATGNMESTYKRDGDTKASQNLRILQKQALMEQKTLVQQKINNAKYPATGIILQKCATQSKVKKCTL